MTKDLKPCKKCGSVGALLIRRTTWDSPIFVQCFNTECLNNSPVVFAKTPSESWRPLHKKAKELWNEWNTRPTLSCEEIYNIILNVQEVIERDDHSIYILQSHRRRIAKAIKEAIDG